MLVCSDPTIEYTDAPRDVADNQGQWATLRFGDVELSNALNLLRWDSLESVQVIICACGVVGCGMGGYVAVHRLDQDIVWLPVAISTITESDDSQDWIERMAAPPPVVDHASILFPRRAWEMLRRSVPSMPAVESIPEIPAHRLGDL